MLYTIYVCLHIVVSNTYCVLFIFVFCTIYFQFLWIVHFWSPLRYSLILLSHSKIDKNRFCATWLTVSCKVQFSWIFRKSQDFDHDVTFTSVLAVTRKWKVAGVYLHLLYNMRSKQVQLLIIVSQLRIF